MLAETARFRSDHSEKLMGNTLYFDYIGPVCGIYFLARVLRWLRGTIPVGQMTPWPGYVRASWYYNAGQRRADVIMVYPRAFYRLYRSYHGAK